MLVPSLLTLVIATAAIWLSAHTKEEVIKVAMASTALIASFLALCFAPWELKLMVIAIPFAIEKLSRISARRSSDF
ncbi:MAG: riboflavin synthase subunit alpha [Chloroflexaceae bacterium]|nr:riboflavin synthase subunit alpha [Chloroflexaceae bacterium]